MSDQTEALISFMILMLYHQVQFISHYESFQQQL